MTIIKIGASWCLSCHSMDKKLKQIKDKYNIDIKELDYDFDDEEVDKYNIGEKLPVLIFMKDDKEVCRLNGEKNISDIEEVLNKYEED